MLENLEVTPKSAYTYSFSFNIGNDDYDGTISFDEFDERGQTVVEWSNEAPTDWENIEDTLIGKCEQ